MIPEQQDHTVVPALSDDALRASDRERERAVSTLRDAGAEGRIGVDELEGRTERALRARTRGELCALTADLPPTCPSARAPAGTRAPRRRPRLRRDLAAYLAVNLLLIAVWAATGADYFWPIWPLLGWGVGILGHARPARGRVPGHSRSASGRRCSA